MMKFLALPINFISPGRVLAGLSGYHGYLWAGILFLYSLPASAQPSSDPLRLLPNDLGFCLVIHDLKGQFQTVQKTPWWKAWKESPLGQAVGHSAEFKKLLRLREEIQRRMDMDWEPFRDDVLGHRVILGYRPPVPNQPETEEGMLLVQARNPELLAKFVERFNAEQKKTGELKELTSHEYHGTAYFRRIHVKNTQYYALDGNLLIYAGRESTLKGLLDARRKSSDPGNTAIGQALIRAGADKAVLAFWVNPRAFDLELEQQAAKANPRDVAVIRAFHVYWRALESIVISAQAGADLEMKLSLQVGTGTLPKPLQRMFHEPTKTSGMWSRFPSNALFAVAGRLDLASVAETFGDFATPDDRKILAGQLQKTLGAALGLDLHKELYPNLGPGWGFCLIPGEGDKPVPQFLAALAVQPGPQDVAVDQALAKGLQFFASLAVFEYNRTHPDPIRVKSLLQGPVEVKYLSNDLAFPQGFQPAWALKDGFLVAATAPGAIEKFQPLVGAAAADASIARVSALELAKYLRLQRDWIVEQIAQKNQLPKNVANQGLEMMLSVLDLFERVQLVQSSGQGQLQWTVRFQPRIP